MVDKIQIRRGTSAEWSSSNPTLDTGEFGLDTTLAKIKIGDGSTAWNSLGFSIGGGGSGGALIGMQVFTTAGTSTYTPTAGTTKCKVYVTGGGGGGGGIDTDGADSSGGGGQGGATGISLVDVADIDGDTITVGVAGAAGIASGGGNGGAGGESSVGSDVTAAGGSGGGGTTSGAVGRQSAAQTIVGDIQIKGGDGEPSGSPIGYASGQITNPNVPGNPGGSTYWASGICGNTVFAGNTSAGVDAEGYGTGGTGALATNNGAATIGGAGADGIVVIEEYGIPQYVINTYTGTPQTLALVDAQALVEMDNASANVVTIPANSAVPFPIGTIISVIMFGAGTTSITGDTGVTLNGVSAGSGDISAQYGGVSLYKRGTDEWAVQGAIGAVS